jgi:hypothetical protein
MRKLLFPHQLGFLLFEKPISVVVTQVAKCRLFYLLSLMRLLVLECGLFFCGSEWARDISFGNILFAKLGFVPYDTFQPATSLD